MLLNASNDAVHFIVTIGMCICHLVPYKYVASMHSRTGGFNARPSTNFVCDMHTVVLWFVREYQNKTHQQKHPTSPAWLWNCTVAHPVILLSFLGSRYMSDRLPREPEADTSPPATRVMLHLWLVGLESQGTSWGWERSNYENTRRALCAMTRGKQIL